MSIGMMQLKLLPSFLFPFEAQISLCSFGSWMGHHQKEKKDCSALVKRMMVVLLYINILFFSFLSA
jgi:hypothetical protein